MADFDKAPTLNMALVAPVVERSEAQRMYDESPELQAMPAEALASPTVYRSWQRREV